MISKLRNARDEPLTEWGVNARKALLGMAFPHMFPFGTTCFVEDKRPIKWEEQDFRIRNLDPAAAVHLMQRLMATNLRSARVNEDREPAIAVDLINRRKVSRGTSRDKGAKILFHLISRCMIFCFLGRRSSLASSPM